MQQASPNGHGSESGQTSDALRRFVTTAFKRKRLIAWVFSSIVGIVTLASFIMPPTFRATATILIEREQQSDTALLFRMNLPSQYEKYDWLKSELEILNSYPVTARVVNSLGFAEQPEENDDEARKEFEKEVLKFQKKLSVELARGSNVIAVGFEEKNARLAARTANEIVATYLHYRSEVHDESGTYRFLEEQMQIADNKLRELEQSQAKFKHREHLIAPDTQLEILLNKLADFEKTVTTVRTRRIGKEAKLAVVKEQLDLVARDVSIPSTDVSDSPSREKYIAKLKGELLDMEIRKDRLLQRFKPTYEEIIELKQDIAATRDKIKSEIRQIIREEETAIKALIAEERALRQSIAGINREVSTFAQKEYEMAQISRGIDDKREVYSMLLKQREEARLSLAKLERGVKVKIISPAVVPTKPDRPRKLLNILLAAIVGLLGGFAAAFIVEINDHSVNSKEELEDITGVRALGSVRDL